MLCTNLTDGKVARVLKNLEIDGDEKLVAFFDETVFITGSKGLLGTSKRLIKFSKKERNEYKLQDLIDIKVVEIDKQNYIYKLRIVKKDQTEVDITPKGIPNDELILLSKLLKSALKI